MSRNRAAIFWAGLGLAVFSATLGALVGASHTAVAGVFITAIFGIVVAVLGLLDSKAIDRKLEVVKSEIGGLSLSKDLIDEDRLLSALRESLLPDPAKLGKLLLLFSVAFSLGIVGGALLRVNDWPPQRQVARHLPWAPQDSPTLPYNALDWIVIQDSLLKMGYSEEQVRHLYASQSSLWKKSGETVPSSGLVTKSEPLSALLKGHIDAAAPESSKGLVVLNTADEGKDKYNG